MKDRWTTPDGIKEFKLLMEGERIAWTRTSLQLRRYIDIYPETLTPEQQQRLSEIEQELLNMAYKAEDETKTLLRGK
jgi:hypothetical protein